MSYPWQITYEQCLTHCDYLDPYNCQECNYVYHCHVDHQRRAEISRDIINLSNSTSIPLQHVSEPNDIFRTDYEELGLLQYIRGGESQARRMYAEMEDRSQQLLQSYDNLARDIERCTWHQQEREECYRQEEMERRSQQLLKSYDNLARDIERCTWQQQEREERYRQEEMERQYQQEIEVARPAELRVEAECVRSTARTNYSCHRL